MAIHLSCKALALGLVVFVLITAFGTPRDMIVSLFVTPAVAILDEPRHVVDHVRPVLGPRPAPEPGAVLEVRATAYNSLESQTNAQPFITATGERTRWGIVAVSRDLLREELPYGSLVRLTDHGNFHTGRGAGAFQTLLDGTGTFIVEDTMHPRKANQIDVWFQDYASAVNWGVRRLEVEVVRLGRVGEPGDDVQVDGFQVDPRWLAAR
jgi:3D (Asp-Asp-Asp) domain-containing protein